jgi:hypothetical protein
MRKGRGRDDKGLGGFLESILAVMVVITASSVFMVILSASTVQEGPVMDGDELIDALCEQGLWARDGGSLEYDLLEARFASIPVLPGDLTGMCLIYRTMGGTEPLLTLGLAPPIDATVYSERAPLLLSIDARTVSAMVEVRAW